MRLAGILAATFGLALAGLILGYGLGVLAGSAWVAAMNTSSFEGYSAMLVFFGFAPVGAVIGALALPVTYLVWRSRRQGAR